MVDWNRRRGDGGFAICDEIDADGMADGCAASVFAAVNEAQCVLGRDGNQLRMRVRAGEIGRQQAGKSDSWPSSATIAAKAMMRVRMMLGLKSGETW